MAASKPYTRIPALDAARALGVAAMVAGHTLDALLAPALRAHPAVVAYWKARGFTAPVFIAVAGWAVSAAIQRSGARGWAIPASRARRAALLVAIGTLLYWPGWGLDALLHGDAGVFAHLVSFGVLHTIGLSILATALLFAALPGRRERLLALAASALLAVALGMRPAGSPDGLAAIALEQAIGGTSPFPLFPWMAYFFAGAAVGLLVVDGGRREAAWLGGIGAAIVGATCWTGVGTMPFNDPVLVVYRIGVFLLLIAALSRVPAAAAARLAPLGRASLGVYAIHVPIVYGWSTHPGLAARIGQRLGVGEGLLVAAVVLLFSLAAQRVLKDAWRWTLAGLDRGRDALGRAWAAAGRFRV
ncbi:MAG TPA: heparan-alpha-glucosaminide N-acetyltransferase domain-containing protein [Anaeromyxobacteraceae bacterium]|nr:heparan-alpha-glucosaminide N-acetyltransferase domain-containing protein [Anaeromyxobacteraceae bacterium]